MLGARYKVRREAETGAALEQDFGARDILLVPAGQPHAVHWMRRAGIVSLQISERFVAEPDFLAVRDRFVTVAAGELYASMVAEEPITPVFAEALAIGVAHRIASHRIASIALRSGVRKSVVVRRLAPVLLRRIERYIEQNLERQLGLSELAAPAELSRWYFLRVFCRDRGDVASRVPNRAALGASA